MLPRRQSEWSAEVVLGVLGGEIGVCSTTVLTCSSSECLVAAAWKATLHGFLFTVLFG